MRVRHWQIGLGFGVLAALAVLVAAPAARRASIVYAYCRAAGGNPSCPQSAFAGAFSQVPNGGETPGTTGLAPLRDPLGFWAKSAAVAAVALALAFLAYLALVRFLVWALRQVPPEESRGH